MPWGGGAEKADGKLAEVEDLFMLVFWSLAGDVGCVVVVVVVDEVVVVVLLLAVLLLLRWPGVVGCEVPVLLPQRPPLAQMRSDERAMFSTGRQRAWKMPSASLGARSVRRLGNPPASMLRARMSSASFTPPAGRLAVMSQWILEMLGDAR